jgi:NTE family protein
MLMLYGTTLQAQPATPQPSKRPKVALVLAGGAAKGIAHAGVLRWLEEHQIPIDSIAGTSIGGLVGGAYATGMSADDVQGFLRGLDWDTLLGGDVPHELKSFRRKQDSQRFPVGLEVGLRGGLKLSSGLDSGHQIGLVLSRIALPYGTLRHFDDLPIPFRCVATDIRKGASVVLEDGSLAEALRATMAIPVTFSPVRRDDRLLVDGGVLNNLPVDVALALGADIVIAVHLPLKESVGTLSLVGLADRALDVMITATTERQLALADVVITPDIEEFESTDWDRVDELEARGYAAAESRAALLEALALDAAQWKLHLARREARRRAALDTPAFARVVGIPERPARDLSVQLANRFQDRAFDQPAFERALTLITGTGRYESALYEGVLDDGEPGLQVRVQEKTHAPPFVNFGADIRSQSDELVFDFGARMTALDTLGWGSELRVDMAAGSRLGGAIEAYRPLGRGPVFVAPRLFAERTSGNVYQSDSLLAVVRTQRYGGGIDAGVSLGRWGEVRAGYGLNHRRSTVRVGPPDTADVSGKEERFDFQLALDNLDSATIPRRGFGARASTRWYTKVPNAATEDDSGRFLISEATTIAAWPMGRGDRLLLDVRGGTTWDYAPPLLYEFTLGGPFQLGSFAQDKFRGAHFAYAGASFYKRTGRLPAFAGGGFFLVGGVEAGSAFDDFGSVRWHGDVTIGAALDTVLGPIFAGGAFSNEGASFYLSIGASFPFRRDVSASSSSFR